VPWPVAVQVVVAVGVKVQVKSLDSPAASVAVPPCQLVQPLPPTDTFVIVESPVFVSVTVIVTGVPAATVVPGVTLFVVSVVDGWITVTVPAVPVAGASLPRESLA